MSTGGYKSYTGWWEGGAASSNVPVSVALSAISGLAESAEGHVAGTVALGVTSRLAMSIEGPGVLPVLFPFVTPPPAFKPPKYVAPGVAVASVANYIGRTIDVLAMYGQKLTGDNLLTAALAMPEMGGQICTGIQKLVQRWMLEFLTETGSIIYLPDRGSTFMTAVLEGYLRTTIDATQAFYLAASQVQNTLNGDVLPTDPPDEVLANVNLLDMAVSDGKIALRVQIVSQAGTSREVIMPIAIVPGMVN